jgi:hypothetical protein
MAQINSYFSSAGGHWLIESTLIGAGTFLMFLVLAALLPMSHFFRFSAIPLRWTYLPKDNSAARAGADMAACRDNSCRMGVAGRDDRG